MDENRLSDFYNDEKVRSATVDKLKLWLMPFVFFTLLGFPTSYGGYVTTFSNFTAQAFFILCGFFNLAPNRDMRIKKIKKALKRSFFIFLIMLLSYIAINLAYLAYCDALNGTLAAEILRKRVAFNFFALNIWIPLPMGSSIWFIQSLFYAYVFFLICEKLKLSKFYLPLLILLLAVMFGTGEFAALLKFPHFGYNYIPAGAVTRAIPYMLIGMLIRRHIDKIGKIPRFIYPLLFVIGLGLAFAEFELLKYFNLLVYTGHAAGFGIMAVSVCCFALAKPITSDYGFYANHSRNYARRLYILCQPVSLLIYMVGPFLSPGFILYYRQYDSIISLIVCFTISIVIGTVKHTILVNENKNRKT